jgi:hypothetical protein
MSNDWRVPRFDVSKWAAFDAVVQLLAPAEAMLANFRSAEEWRKAFMRLTPGQRMLYAVNKLEMEVNGDGFTHYFFYDGADSLFEAAEGLRKFGAPEGFGRALAEACRVFPGGRVPTDWNERESVMEAIEEKGDIFRQMEVLFGRSYEGKGLSDYGLGYVVDHPDEFFVMGRAGGQHADAR